MATHIKPARAGLIVRDPAVHGEPLPDKGKPYVKSLALVRAIMAGDAILFDPDEDARKAKAEAEAAERAKAAAKPKSKIAIKDDE